MLTRQPVAASLLSCWLVASGLACSPALEPLAPPPELKPHPDYVPLPGFGVAVSSCGPDGRGYVAPISGVGVSGRGPPLAEVDEEFDELGGAPGRYLVLHKQPTFTVGGYGRGCLESGIQPTCRATVIGRRIELEANMCFSCDRGRPGKPVSFVGRYPHASCSAGSLERGDYTLFFRGEEIATFTIPSITHVTSLGRRYPPPSTPGPAQVNLEGYGITVPTCGPDRQGWVAPIRSIAVLGKGPPTSEQGKGLDNPQQYTVLPRTLEFVVTGYGERWESRLTPCTAKLEPGNVIRLEAELCIISDPVTEHARRAPPAAYCAIHRLEPGKYTLVFRGETITSLEVPGIAPTESLIRTYPLPSQGDAGVP